MEAFREREEEFKLAMVDYETLDGGRDPAGTLGMLCQASTDAEYVKQWGQQRFDDDYVRASSRKPPAARADSERQVAHRFLPPMARMTPTSRTRSPPSSQRRP